jgi:hypothetical protein
VSSFVHETLRSKAVNYSSQMNHVSLVEFLNHVYKSYYSPVFNPKIKITSSHPPTALPLTIPRHILSVPKDIHRISSLQFPSILHSAINSKNKILHQNLSMPTPHFSRVRHKNNLSNRNNTRRSLNPILYG